MNEEIILQMVQPYVQDSALTYDEFNNIFKFLNIKEQYKVADILFRNGINLIDEHSTDIIFDISDDDAEEDAEFEILYDKGIFQDDDISDEGFLQINKNIKQSNDILCHLIQEGNLQAKQDLCIKNRGLVDKYVAGYQKRYGNRLDFEDLEQVGFMGLIKAAQKFDFSQETSFSTYAVYWIKQAISREIMDNGYAIRIPVHMMERINKVVYLNNSFGSMEMSEAERIVAIAERLFLSEDEVKECLILKKNYLSYVSLNALVGEEEDSELGEFVPQDEILGTEEIAEVQFLHEALEEVISSLKPKEQDVIKLRFGLEDGRTRTLEEVGKQYGVTRERIRQIEEKALKKLRHPKYTKKIKDYLI